MIPPSIKIHAISALSALALLSGASLGPSLSAQESAADDELASAPEDRAWFEENMQPLLSKHCLKCHGGGERIRGELDLSSRAGVLEGGVHGPAVDLELASRSLLLDMLSYRDEDHQMPPPGKLPPAELALFEEWARRGAPHAVDGERADDSEEPARKLGRHDGREGWSYRPLTRPSAPALEDSDWTNSPIDAFVLARLEEAGLSPAPAAEPATLLRRLSYDLTGLPPSAEELERFLHDEAPDAWERAIDDYLARPEYGQRWARHWLDVVRYAETNGYERDTNKPEIWRYRDWVVNALNADLPYDDFIRMQLAGDELGEGSAESAIATGYYRLMQWDDEPGQGVLQARYDVLADLVDVTSSAFLGMSMGCARCHDHKADPILQTDYYGLMAYFHGVTDMSVGGYLTDVTPPRERAAQERERSRREEESTRLASVQREAELRLMSSLSAEGRVLGGPGELINLSYRFYRDTWESLPDFDSLRPEDVGELVGGRFDLAPATREDAIGFVFEGALDVPVSGEYGLRLTANQGARLTVGEARLGSGQGKPAEARVHLSGGRTRVRLDWHSSDGEPALAAEWTPTPRRPWHYTLESPPAGWELEGFDASAWELGEPGFGREDAPGGQVKTPWESADIWMCGSFPWDAGAEPVIVANHDDDLTVWINGVEALRRGGSRGDYGVFELSPQASAALRPGENKIAVHCHQGGGTQYVHAEVVPRHRLASLPPGQLAFGWASLSALDEDREQEELGELMRTRGAEFVGPDIFAEWQAAEEEIARLADYDPPRTMAAAVQERRDIPQMFVHLRGNAASHGDEVDPHTPGFLSQAASPAVSAPNGSSGRRLALAEWIASDENPLTARVAANRVWQHHFGRGIVGSPNDLGELGERPTHPGLLDWLASELISGGWSLKHLHREILRSSTYRMSSRAGQRALVNDAENQLYSRFEMRRLSAEELRDSILWLADILDTRVGGPPFFSLIPDEVLATSSRPKQVWGTSPESEVRRRSIYIKVKRSLRTPVLDAFDFADTDQSCPARFTTTTPIQSLELISGDFTQQRSVSIAERLRSQAGDDPRDAVSLGLRLACAREPLPGEVESYLSWMIELQREFDLTPEQALQNFSLLLINLNEFSYLD